MTARNAERAEDALLRPRSRRQFLARAGVAAGALTVGGCDALRVLTGVEAHPHIKLGRLRQPQKTRAFTSRPDLHPPGVAVATSDEAADDGYLLVGPGALGWTQPGPLIVDAHGEPLWFHHLTGHGWVANFRTWELDGQPVLAWWRGDVLRPLGYGRGHAHVVDSSYTEVRRISAVGAHEMDVHELRLTPEGTALFTCYPRTVTVDLRSVGGGRDAKVLESVIQEVDLRTGRLLFEWRSLNHIPIEESYRPVKEPYDYVHINSIAVCPDGNLLVSGRHTWALYKLDRRTGEVIWRLGGKRSSFEMGRGAQFRWQHDAEHLDESTITLFDNGSDGVTKPARESRGVVLALDLSGRRVSLAHEYRHPRKLMAGAMGSIQVLPTGNVVVGWGSEPYVSEFTPDGTLVADARMPDGQQSYRGFRLPWKGQPREEPATAVVRDKRARATTVYASWNGATEVAYWQLHAGHRRSALRAVRTFARAGFDTKIAAGDIDGWIAATALDETGRPLASSRPVWVD
jgi:hypothetical protein